MAARNTIARLVLCAALLATAALAGPAAAQVPGPGQPPGAQEKPAQAAQQPVPAAENQVAADFARMAGEAPDPMLGTAQKAVTVFRARMVDMFQRVPGAFDAISTALAGASPTGRGIYFLGVAIFAALLLVVGQAVTAFYVHFVARPIFIRMQAGPAAGYTDKLPVLVNRVLMTIVALILVVSVASAVGLFFYEDHEASQVTVITIFATFAAVVLVDAIWRMTLAPFLPRFRLPDIGDTEARRLYRWLTVASTFAIAATAFCYWIQALGLPHEVHVLVTIGLMLVTVVLFLVLIRANRATISGAILGGVPRAEANWLARAGAALWAPLASAYLVATWANLSFRLVVGTGGAPGRLLVPYVTLIAGLVVYASTIYAIERLFARQNRLRAVMAGAAERRAEAGAAAVAGVAAGDEDEAEEPDAPGQPGPAGAHRPGTMRTMEDLARRVASLFAIGAAGYALVMLWLGTRIFTGNVLVETVLDVLQVSFIGYIVFHAARIWLDRRIEDEGGDIELTPGEEGGAAGATRLATLLPLVRNFILIVILTAIALIVASRLGANVAPLFAGAGIVGLAIGFGSQTLVRDILSGAFFLLDDAFRKGEYIDVGQVKGTVEKISIRSFQLRHHLGMLHTIPFGDIKHLTNFSRDWVMMKLPLRLTYDTDIERVRKLIKKLGQSLLEDPEVGAKFLQPLKSQGVIQMDDSAMIVRVKFMTRPGDQWVVRKRVFTDIRSLFEREGIAFANREVTVRIPGIAPGQEIDDRTRQAAGAAARRTLDVIEAEIPKKTGTSGPIDDR